MPKNISDDPCLRKIQIEARQSLATAARRLRSLRGTQAERRINWSKPGCPGHEGTIRAKFGRGYLIIWPPKKGDRGVQYTSSFGPDSDKSFSGYLPGLTLEEAKLLVYHEASKHW